MTFLDSWIADKIADSVSIVPNNSVKIGLQTKDKLVESYIKLRTEYGTKHHWPLNDDDVDIDRYDSDAQTSYFLAVQKSGWGQKKLIAGTRLTKVGSLEDSLSLSMWAHAVDKPHVVSQMIDNKHDITHLKQMARVGNLWDLTRLVTEMSLHEKRSPQDKRATYVALLLILGAAFKYTGR